MRLGGRCPRDEECRCSQRQRKGPSPQQLYHGLALSQLQLHEMKDDLQLGLAKDPNLVRDELERKKEDSRRRIQEFRDLDDKMAEGGGKAAASLSEDLERAKRAFYRERAGVLELRECEDLQDMSSFVCKAKCQAIRDAQLRQKEVAKQDGELLLEGEMEERAAGVAVAWEREQTERAAEGRLKEAHLRSLKFMMEEKEIQNKLKNLTYQRAAMTRNNHTAYRLKKRIDEIKTMQENNKTVRALQRGVYENKHQMELIRKEENRLLEERERKFFERKSDYLKKYNNEKAEIQRIKDENLKKIYDDALKRLQNQEEQLEIAYIRDKDLADKKWRMEGEEKERARLAYRQQLWAEQEQTKEDILDHVCLATERDRLHFQRIVRENQEDFNQEQKVEREKRKKAEAVRKDLQCTINEKIDKKREEREEMIRNAHNQVVYRQLYQKHHNQEMYRELHRLRNEGLEDKYVTETIRHCNISPDQKLKPSLI